MFIIDVETLDLESTATVLAIGMVHLSQSIIDDPDSISVSDLMKNNSLMVKLSVEEQGLPNVLGKKRTISKDTLEFWKIQREDLKKLVLYPDDERDLSVSEGIEQIKQFMKLRDPYSKDMVFSRGVLDPMVFSSLCKHYSIYDPIKYNRYRDIRTLIDCLTGSSSGYVESSLTSDIELTSHHPVHDCIKDAMRILKPKLE